jgi:hypothetical protein
MSKDIEICNNWSRQNYTVSIIWNCIQSESMLHALRSKQGI